MKPKLRIAAAVKMGEKYGPFDGGHHKQWVIDQMIRILLGAKDYAKWVEAYNADPNYDDWDEGIPP